MPGPILDLPVDGTHFLRSDGAWVSTPDGSAAAVAAHVAAVDPHGDRAYTDTEIADLAAVYPTVLSGSPSAPVLTTVGSVAAGNSPTMPVVAGDYLFLTVNSDDAVWAYSIADRDAPVKVGQVTVGDAPGHVVHRGDHLFVYNANSGTLSVVDVTDPTAMTLAATLTLSVGSGGQRITHSPDKRYILIGGPESGGNANVVTLVDTINPTSPVEVSTLAVGTVQRNVVPLGPSHFGLVSRDTNTFHVLSYANPARLTAVGSLSGLSSTLTAAAVDPLFDRGRPYVYLNAYGNGTLYVVDCLDPTNPRLLGQATGAVNTEWSQVVGRYLFVSTRTTHTIDVFDVGHPAKPTLAASLNVTAAARLDRFAYANGRIYAGDQNGNVLWTVAVTGGKALPVVDQGGGTRQPTVMTARKTADETVNTSAVLQEDDALTVRVEAGAVYQLDLFLAYESSTSADLRLGWVYPSGTTIGWCPTGPSPSTTSTGNAGTVVQYRAAGDITTLGGYGAGTPVVARAAGLVTVGATAGSVTVQWAQQTSEGSDTIVKAGSYLTLRKL